jgi:hypothetical protein
MPRSLLAVILFLLSISCVASAQTPQTVPAAQPTPDPAIEKQAVDLLETIAGQLTSLHAPHNRVQAASIVGDLLWIRDEKRARSLFKTATTDLARVLADLDYSDPQSYQEISLINQQRQQIVDRLAQRDPDLALAFVRETRLETPANDVRPNWYGQNETNLELHLAELIAARDPARALKLARATLARGVSYSTNSLLSQIQLKDPATAQTLYTEMVEQIKNEDLARDQELASAGWSLIASFLPPQAKEETYRDLIDTMSSAALAITQTDRNGINFSQNLGNQIDSVMPQLEKFAPTRAAALKQWSQEVERALDPATKMYKELNEIGQNGTVDDLLALAPKYAQEYRGQVYQNAAWKAFSNGDVARARQIINDLITDPIQRRQMLENFDNQTLNNAANENKIAVVRQMLTKIKNLDRKAQILIELGNSLANKGDKKAALDLLNEARTLIVGARGSAQLFAQISLAQAYSRLDVDQSFAIMQTLIVKANELIAAAAVLDGYENRYLKQGEWMSPGQSVVANMINNLTVGLASLAHYDFGRARALADQLERPEIRLVADVQIAQAALGGNPGNLQMYFSGRGLLIGDEE